MLQGKGWTGKGAGAACQGHSNPMINMAGVPGTQISCEDWGIDGEMKFYIKTNIDIYGIKILHEF